MSETPKKQWEVVRRREVYDTAWIEADTPEEAQSWVMENGPAVVWEDSADATSDIEATGEYKIAPA